MWRRKVHPQRVLPTPKPSCIVFPLSTEAPYRHSSRDKSHELTAISSLAATRTGWGPMDATDQECAIVSDLADLDRVRLADLRVMTDEATSSVLRRVVPATPGQGVSVAAFNSCV